MIEPVTLGKIDPRSLRAGDIVLVRCRVDATNAADGGPYLTSGETTFLFGARMEIAAIEKRASTLRKGHSVCWVSRGNWLGSGWGKVVAVVEDQVVVKPYDGSPCELVRAADVVDAPGMADGGQRHDAG